MPMIGVFLAAFSFDDPNVIGGLVFVAFILFVLVGILLSRMSNPRELEKRRAEFREFPTKLRLTPTENGAAGQVYEGKAEGFRVLLKIGAAQAPQDDRKRPAVRAGYVCVSVQCARPQPPGLQLWKESLSDAARKETRKLNEVVVGDHELDRALIIRGTQAAQIKEFICQPEVREKLLDFFEEWPLSIVTDYWVKCENDEGEPGTQLLDTMFFYALGVAKALDEHAVKPGSNTGVQRPPV